MSVIDRTSDSRGPDIRIAQVKTGLINIGNELLNGQTQNSHHSWIAREWTLRGWQLTHQQTIKDTPEEIVAALRQSMSANELVITTGGLGPTSDDITREVVAGFFNLKLEKSPEVEKAIREYFSRRQRPMPESVLVQANIPEGGIIFANNFGTAPGLAIFHPTYQSWLVMLPGPPRELHPMMMDQVIPFLKHRFIGSKTYVCRVLRTVGIGESRIQEMIEPELQDLMHQGLEVGYCARTGEVDVRLASDAHNGESLVDQALIRVRHLVGKAIFSEEERTLEAVVVELLLQKHMSVATAESCTGGYLAHRFTSVPGASGAYLGGAITYSNAEKIRQLGVHVKDLECFGAVSWQVAKQMAEGIRRVTGADFGLATTGIAGPSGGTDEKPVGLVHMAVAGPNGTETFHRINAFDRETFKFVTTQQVLDCLRLSVAHTPEQ